MTGIMNNTRMPAGYCSVAEYAKRHNISPSVIYNATVNNMKIAYKRMSTGRIIVPIDTPVEDYQMTGRFRTYYEHRMPAGYLTLKHYCRKYKVAYSRLYRKVQQNKIPYLRLPNNYLSIKDEPLTIEL